MCHGITTGTGALRSTVTMVAFVEYVVSAGVSWKGVCVYVCGCLCIVCFCGKINKRSAELMNDSFATLLPHFGASLTVIE